MLVSCAPLRNPSTVFILPKHGRKNSSSSVRWLLSTRPWYPFRPFTGDASPAYLRWDAAGAVVGTAGSVHKACFPFGEMAFHPLTDGVAGDGEPSGGLPEAATLFQGRLERRKARLLA